MTQRTRVYPLDPGMTQEQMAVTFAMTSRSPEPFDEIAQRVTEESSAQFNERWVLSYGHSSVAEHAVLHLAVENISRVACDALEDNRLASYTEKSSRYQVMTKTGFHLPAELDGWPAQRAEFQEVCRALFGHYQGLLNRLREHLQDTVEALEDETAPAHRMRLRRQATDAARSVLPAAILTNVGVTANARTVSNMISKLLSSHLQEERKLGQRLLAEGGKTAPTLLKHAGASEHLRLNRPKPGPYTWQDHPGQEIGSELKEMTVYPEMDIAAAILYGEGEGRLEDARRTAGRMGRDQLIGVIDRRMREMGDHDGAIREFENADLLLELMLDYGAYREFHRHRMQSCWPQPMTVGLGYRTPGLVGEAGLEGEFQEAMETARQGCAAIGPLCPQAAPYLVTHAHHRGLIVRMNLREAYHVLRLRTSLLAHESIREPMREVLRQLMETQPDLLRWLRLRDQPEWWPQPWAAEQGEEGRQEPLARNKPHAGV